MAVHKWQFASRFRRHAFGWNASHTAVQRIKEAVAEIKQVARKEPVLAAEGAISLIAKLTPALEHIDSSSGALGSAVCKAIETLVPVIAKPDVEAAIRKKWLERLWQAIQEDDIPYIEALADYWGELCASPEIASAWADEVIPFFRKSWCSKDHVYIQGSTACLSALFSAGRYEELLAILGKAQHAFWHNRRWGVKVLVSMDKLDEAIQFAEDSRGLNQPDGLISEACESILLSAGKQEEAYQRYAIQANQCTTHLATFKAIAKKYPNKEQEQILRDLIASTPGSEGKWFAAAKDAGLYQLAAELVKHSPTDPRTLTRAARDFGETEPDFALACGLAALHWMAQGYGYELTATDVGDAYKLTTQAAKNSGMPLPALHEQIDRMLTGKTASLKWVREILNRYW